MKTKLLLLLFVVTVRLCAVSQINISAYGAVGDGVADDASAIQAAFNAADALINKYLISGTNDATYPEIVFDQGDYRITATITYPTRFKVTARGRARIIPDGVSGYALDYNPGVTHAEQGEIENLTFVGGNGVHLKSNSDNNNIVLRNVRFMGNAVALDVDCQSGIVRLENCHWQKCSKEIINRACDYLVMQGGRVNGGTRTANQQAGIDNYGKLVIHDVLFVPGNGLGSYTECAWINNYVDSAVVSNGGRSGIVQITGGYFGAEPGSMTVVNNFANAATTYIFYHTVVSIKDSSVWSSDGTVGAGRGIVRLFKIPNDLQLIGNTGFMDCFALSWGSGVTPSTEVAGKERLCRVRLDNVGQYEVSGYDDPANYMLPELFALESVGGTLDQAGVSLYLSTGRNNRIISNAYGASDAYAALPAAKKGMNMTFINGGAHNYFVIPVSGDQIRGASAINKYIELSDPNIGIEFVCIANGVWEIGRIINGTFGVGYSFEP